METEKSSNGKSGSLLDRLKTTAKQEGAASAKVDPTSTLAKAATGGTQLGGSKATTDVVVSADVARQTHIIKPKKTKESQVLFSIAGGRSLGSPMKDGKMVRFQNGYLLTEDKDVIEFVRTNAKAWGVKEEK